MTSPTLPPSLWAGNGAAFPLMSVILSRQCLGKKG